VVEKIKTYEDMATAIKDMHVRGAGLIGAAAGYGMYLAARQALEEAETSVASDAHETFQTFVHTAASRLVATRPTAVNLEHAVNRQKVAMEGTTTLAFDICDLSPEWFSLKVSKCSCWN
jgi:methylthioribose-1-phosphate isomerase